MKTYFVFLCLLIGGGFASATTQTTANQDKPSRLYVKSYGEADNQSGLDYGTGAFSSDYNGYYYNWTTNIYTQTQTYQESLDNWTDGAPGSFTQTTNYQDSNTHGPNGTQDTIATLSWPQGSWPNLSGTEVVSSTGDWTYDYPFIWHTNTFSTSTSTNQSVSIYQEHCDINIVSNWTYYAGSGSGTWNGTVNAKARRTAQATMHLQTGGKATSKLKNLFKFTGSATKINDGITDWEGDLVQASAQGVSPQNIIIGNYGAANTNGTKYLILPDSADVDVTPYVAGVDYYTFSFNTPQKYHSYFDLFVQQANPGYSLNFYNPTNDVGHAFWRFRTDAPSDALQYISPNLTSFLNTPWGFYPSGGLFTVPGQLQNDSGHSANISRTFYIGFSDLINGLEYTKGISNAPPVYVLTAFNCVGAARDAGFEADIFGLPWDESPQNFGVTLMKMYPAPGQIIGPFVDTNDVFYSSAPY